MVPNNPNVLTMKFGKPLNRTTVNTLFGTNVEEVDHKVNDFNWSESQFENIKQ